mmetsp:Transcript_19980/g.57856  ORF Transcript_19980/g.57856 Transcript_19980/m.57856 type:complete len:1015 (-) Transcript_19980:383-3427(-)|eukprot:CAMPEP_0113531018 /NCGR_PEP_ID=MMETSP0015_2-20120614/3265_1 /TAXON_ID=2838 /ORGANISM="Odontella" /LENGTH=1014 /DNA_ID=CAMNT_0000429811 /DNA_START=119 /DNA_END=3163 /DNA_ORIENTATION=- /assembly_acc=CAM_ASM_000160
MAVSAGGTLAARALVATLAATSASARPPDRSRLVAKRAAEGRNYGRGKNVDGGTGRALSGQGYRAAVRGDAEDGAGRRVKKEMSSPRERLGLTPEARQEMGGAASLGGGLLLPDFLTGGEVGGSGGPTADGYFDGNSDEGSALRGGGGDGDSDQSSSRRRLANQLTGCCETYSAYSAEDLCGSYGEDCQSGEQPSHDSGDDDCAQDGLSFIGVSFSVNTASGNPYSYQLCDQFPMENIIDRDYDYVMSMDEDGWLVGGGYKQFDYSGKMPYIDSSHTELLRVGSMDTDLGGTSIGQVIQAMSEVELPPLSIFPEYLKGGGGHNSGDGDDEGAPSGDITLVVSVVEVYYDNANYDEYSIFLDNLFQAFGDAGGGSCMDDDDTDPHVSMSRGVKFKSSWHQEQYMYEANLEVAVWQAMYPKGVVIGTKGYASFPPGRGGKKQYVGYGNLYFFFDRANITTAFSTYRDMTDDEKYYATLYTDTDVSSYYASTTTIGFDYSGSGDQGDWEHNPYSWKATSAMHDMTDGWELPPNCEQEGESFFGIPLSTKAGSKLQSTTTFQSQFDFEMLVDRNYTYIQSFGTNHGWLIGELFDNGAGSIVDKDTAHIPIFYIGTTNVDMGGMSLSDILKIAKNIDFGTLYIKPAFVFQDEFGHVKLQFEMDPSSAMAYLYDALCKELGIAWNYDSPYNDLGVYTSCAMHAAGDRAKYGCGPEGENSGGFCPQLTLGYKVRFQSEDHAAAFLNRANGYVDYWRGLYPSGVAVGTEKFCPDGGCLGLYLNRYDLYQVFKPDLGGSWVEYHGASMAPTYSPAPTWSGGCSEPHNYHLDKCFRKRSSSRPKLSVMAWDSLGIVGQFSILLVSFMALTLSVSIFLARARKRKRKGESYIGFFFRDLNRKKRKKKKLRRKKKHKSLGNKDLEEDMLSKSHRSSSRRSRSSAKSRSKSATRRRSKSRSRRERELDQGEDDEKSRRSRRSTSRSKSTRSRSRSRRDKSSERRRDRDEGSDGGEGGESSTPRTQLV